MQEQPDLTQLGALIADRSRARILSALMAGRALTGKELAFHANVSPPTVTSHVNKLLEAGLVRRIKQGRYHYFSLADERVAHALETMSVLAAELQPTSRTPQHLRFARSCYDHIAGTLGVALHDAMLRHALVQTDTYELSLTRAGETRLEALDIDVTDLRTRKRPLLRPCLDWSERRFHLAGAVAASLLTRAREGDWLIQREDSRVLELTATGRVAFEKHFDVVVPPDDGA